MENAPSQPLVNPHAPPSELDQLALALMSATKVAFARMAT